MRCNAVPALTEEARPTGTRAGAPRAGRRTRPAALDFFAGSGLVTEALRRCFDVVWSNDVCPRKAAVYCANHPEHRFQPGRIEDVRGPDLPEAVLSWASFPCQDLSLAGNIEGIHSARSGLVWQWLRVIDESAPKPPLLVAENVVGLLSAEAGAHYRRLHQELVKRGYRAGAVVLDAVRWLPQSRPRVFVVAVEDAVPTEDLETNGPTWCHPAAARRAAAGLDGWVWWRIPEPLTRCKRLEDVIDFDAPVDGPERRGHNLELVPPRHLEQVRMLAAEGRRVFPGYKRTRNGRQVLELRFDGVAGCLRTPEGGSSRQLLVLVRDGRLETRLLTVREASGLMGVRADYEIPGSYNDGYRAIGDAVAVPVARHLAQRLLAPIAERLRQ